MYVLNGLQESELNLIILVRIKLLGKTIDHIYKPSYVAVSKIIFGKPSLINSLSLSSDIGMRNRINLVSLPILPKFLQLSNIY